ncbi:UDP-N-acetylmuramoyl-tripeptide--D-alanyl-D-alanine ligase [Flavobacterium sp. UBA7663]|uniref:UDP-N-acetylmuramoyl-tripeptide--D-alanyl-D- alanine ligase n=1 Tax=Flavobacterium sp. UBA7663 TaxID=1946557 RepID=UPI0025B85F83|nr:UDP-N-acetylmuramoyl-tripeptide--D-alanyl-D-alanine ligase [Flavobacterium sp. UBA7663]
MTTIATLHSLFLNCSSVSTDTRKIEKDSLFIALKGENFDANTFAKEALEKGAKFVIIDNPSYKIDERTLLVEDSLIALQELAKFHRNYLGLPIIALTGSNGKTTTKELIHAVLSKKYNTLATIGNLNNHIGVPLTLLRFTKETEIGIVEMGANHQKEIEFLCKIAQPDYGYITNFGKAHLEGFGGVEGVIKGKSEMYDYLRNNEKIAFINLDDTIQKEKATRIKQFSFGLNELNVDVKIDKVEANPMVKISFNDLTINSHLIGIYNANNINAAIAIGNYFKVSDRQIKEAIENYIPENNRSQLIQKNGNEIILDAYNANPSSMSAAITNFIQLENNHKVAVLGDMFELGEESLSEHKKIIALLISETNITTYFIGKDFYANQVQNSHIKFFENFENFATFFKVNQPKESLILIKGSRGMALEKTLELI